MTVAVDGYPAVPVPDAQASDRQGQPAVSSVIAATGLAASHTLPGEADDTPRGRGTATRRNRRPVLAPGRVFGLMQSHRQFAGSHPTSGSGFPAHLGRACRCSQRWAAAKPVIGCGMPYARKSGKGKIS